MLMVGAVSVSAYMSNRAEALEPPSCRYDVCVLHIAIYVYTLCFPFGYFNVRHLACQRKSSIKRLLCTRKWSYNIFNSHTVDEMTSSMDLLPLFRSALRSFASSSINFRILYTIPLRRTHPTPRTLYILDSSFNPPTLAHLRIASDGLSSHNRSTPRHLLLLLATQNADKTHKPAAFEQRLAMMTLMAEHLLLSFSQNNEDDDVTIDIGVTKDPFFVDKSAAITSSGVYRPPLSSAEQVHLLGYDTFTRIFDSKYYLSHTLAPLNELFTHHRLRVMYRTEDTWGGRQEQDFFLKELREGKMEAKGGKSEWAEKITFVEGRNEEEGATSSTTVRNAAKDGNGDIVAKMCIQSIADWIVKEKLYTSEAE